MTWPTAAGFMPDDVVLIPEPRTGLSARLGNKVANVHEVHDGIVYYGMYEDHAHELPHHCIGLYRLPVEAFKNRLGRAIMDGAATYSLLEPDDDLVLT